MYFDWKAVFLLGFFVSLHLFYPTPRHFPENKNTSV